MYLKKKTVQLFYYEQGAYANFNINKKKNTQVPIL